MHWLPIIPAAALLATSVSAHHGADTFDRNKNVELTGTITGIDFINPHSWVYFDVVGADGTTQAHRCEMRAATVLRRSGWSPEMFRVGEEITISGRGDRVDERSCYLTTIVFADGTRADRYGQLAKPETAVAADRPLRLPSGEPNISGDWAAEQLVMTDPTGRGGALVPLSTVGQYRPGEGTIGEVAAQILRLRRSGLDVLHELLQQFLAPRHGHHHRAARGECLGGHVADTRRGAGDDDDLALVVHARSLLLATALFARPAPHQQAAERTAVRKE